MRRVAKPHNILIVAAIIIFCISFFLNQQTLNLHIRDTYYLIDYKSAFLIASVFLLFLWLMYSFFRNKLFSNRFSWLNIILTVLSISILLTLPIWTDKNQRRSLDLSKWVTFNKTSYDNEVVYITALIFILAQVAFIINIVIGLSRKDNGG